ncbi:hypothetical protein V1517DRAFT_349058 [Lipomyces orientalis]|uniref:Uncharacterized protein n=1 Tax=Lipomyces orientalis TaxID=1233043 RepID=A0ACC3TEE5_9ASCO
MDCPTVRLASGIVVVVYGIYAAITGLTIASIIPLNVGVFPIIAATIGLIRIITFLDFTDNRAIHYGIAFSRVLFLVGIGPVIAGASLEGQYNVPSDVLTGPHFAEAGYIVVTVFVACLFACQALFWTRLSKLSHTSIRVLNGSSAAMLFFVVRLAYSFLSVYHSAQLTWNPLDGPIAPFVVMVLLMEYIVVCIYLFTGFGVKHSATERQVGMASVDEEYGTVSLDQSKLATA